MNSGKHQYIIPNDLSHALLRTDKYLQMFTETEQDQIRDISKNIYNNICNVGLNVSSMINVRK